MDTPRTSCGTHFLRAEADDEQGRGANCFSTVRWIDSGAYCIFLADIAYRVRRSLRDHYSVSHVVWRLARPFSHKSSSIGAIIAKIGYGRDFYEKHGDALIKLSLENMELVVSVITKFWVVDLLPFRKAVSYFPPSLVSSP